MEGEALVEFVGEGVPGPFPSVNLRSLRIRGRPLGRSSAIDCSAMARAFAAFDAWMRYHPAWPSWLNAASIAG